MIWERRWHPLRDEWVTITSHRNTRPWSGANATASEADIPAFEPGCYLCPGNQRVSGKTNESYTGVFVFDNDHPSFGPAAPGAQPAPGIYRSAPASGICRVLCYSPRHNLTLAELPVAGIKSVIDCWSEQTLELSQHKDVASVLIFENKGEIVGVSNPHPHGQIYAPGFVFKSIETELAAMQRFRAAEAKNLFAAMIDTERKDGRRVIAQNDGAIAFVPYFARFPYECYIAPRQSAAFLHELSDESVNALAAVLAETLARLDNLWRISFPYMLVVHQAPCDGGEYPEYHCHIQILPPLRQPGLQKFMAGVETGGGNFLNDTCPEEKAAELRAVPAVHYKQG